MIDTDALSGARDLARRERPLEGLRVLELGSLIAGPFATRIMAEFGAEVIKVERPGAGDPLRVWRYVDPRTETSLWWALQSRNKKLVTLNVGHQDGQALAKRLAAEADILVENFKPGTLEKLGLGWDALHELNPRLILVRVSGYGQTGPYKDRPGFANIGEAMGSIRYVTGEPGRPPVRSGISLGDSLASLYALIEEWVQLHPTGEILRILDEAALETGITTFDASFGGLGGSPNAPGAGGNAATEDLVYMLTEKGIETGVDLESLMDAADLLERLVDHPLNSQIERTLLADPGAAR
jgi:hypothetical protein